MLQYKNESEVPMQAEYVKYIKDNIKLKLTQPDKKSSEHQEIVCLICKHTFVATPKSKMANFRKYKTQGCPECYKKRLAVTKPSRQKLKLFQISKNYHILDTKDNITYTVMRKDCGHIFNAHCTNLRYNKISCKLCNKTEADPLNDILSLKRYGFQYQAIESGHLYLNQDTRMAVIIHIVEKCLEQKVGNRYVKGINEKYRSFGYRVLQFWDTEIIEKHKLISKKIEYIAKFTPPTKIYARNCKIKQIDAATKNDFLEKYHIQGKTSASLSFGAYYKDILVAVMTFSTPRILMNKSYVGKEGVWELSRFATHESYSIVGIASKLLAHFKKSVSWTYIYSFADLRWSIGELYERLNFVEEAKNKPEYYYYIDGKLHHRWGFRRHALAEKYPDKFNSEKTEYENMLAMGYDRVWDAGILKYGMYNETTRI